MGGITNKTVHLSFAVDWSKEVNPLLVIPAELMKMKRPHTASVTRQGISLLNDLLLKTDGFFQACLAASR